MRELLAEAILNKGERKVGAGVVRTMADLARLAIRLEMKALSIARQAPKSDFEATLNSVYAAERAELCDAVAAVYDGRTSVADAKADLTRIRPTSPGSSRRQGVESSRQPPQWVESGPMF